MSKSQEMHDKFFIDIKSGTTPQKALISAINTCTQHMQDMIKARHITTNGGIHAIVKEAIDLWKAFVRKVNEHGDILPENGYEDLLQKVYPDLWKIYSTIEKMKKEKRYH